MRIDIDRLARMGKTGSNVSGLRAMTLDSEGTSIRVHLPTSKDLAALILPTEGRELFKAPGAIAWRPAGTDLVGDDLTRVPLATVIEAVETLLRGLPVLDNEGPAYFSLRFVAQHRADLLRREATEAARALRLRLSDAPQPPKEAKPKRPAMTAAQRKAKQRAREADEHRSSAMFALREYLEDAEPGAKVPGSVVHAAVTERLEEVLEEYEEILGDDLTPEERAEAEEEWRENVEELGWPPRPRLVSRQLLFRVAGDFGFRITRPQNRVTLTIPERSEHTMKNNAAMFEELLDRMARIYAEDYREGFEDYLATRSLGEQDAAEPTGTQRRHLRAV